MTLTILNRRRLRHVDNKPQKTLKNRLPPSELAGRSGRICDTAADPVRFGVAAGQVRSASGPNGVHHRRRRASTSRTPEERRESLRHAAIASHTTGSTGGKVEREKNEIATTYYGSRTTGRRSIVERIYAHRSAVSVFLPVVPHLRRGGGGGQVYPSANTIQQNTCAHSIIVVHARTL